MAFVRENFERVGGGLRQLFIYGAGADTHTAVVASGYFDAVADQINAGDMILAALAGNAAAEVVMVTSARGVKPVTTVRETDAA